MNLAPAYDSHIRYVLFHPDEGVYLGHCLGLGVWSKVDPVGQPEAATFASESEAREHIHSWDSQDLQFNRTIVITPVYTGGAHYATIAQIQAAGLPGWDPNAE